jgi:hypothetical protein
LFVLFGFHFALYSPDEWWRSLLSSLYRCKILVTVYIGQHGGWQSDIFSLCSKQRTVVVFSSLVVVNLKTYVAFKI